ncbi:hypothetical protein [Desulfoplanes formicivorans]|uniref:hypothetical protein n=1 Tax=Desulfoplanes formicivorans TaxID=1592317 RepID=UPI0008530CA9|nr:hypothetical protein [Desulfoplanes formicivorans]
MLRRKKKITAWPYMYFSWRPLPSFVVTFLSFTAKSAKGAKRGKTLSGKHRIFYCALETVKDSGMAFLVSWVVFYRSMH